MDNVAIFVLSLIIQLVVVRERKMTLKDTGYAYGYKYTGHMEHIEQQNENEMK